jgi:hypothetical protein
VLSLRSTLGSLAVPTLALSGLLLALPWAGVALAQTAPPPAERLHYYSPYELQTIGVVLGGMNLTQDPAPDGKVVERVEVVPLDVFEQRDVLPRWLNVFHVTTRDGVVRREVLLHPGERYQQALVDDTIRNLRRLPGVPQLSAVLVVPARGSTPDRIVLVVITKDVWSLRLNWDVVADPGGLDQLVLQPSETNFLGTHQILGATFVLEPLAYTFGGHYVVPSLDHTRVAMEVGEDVVFNKTTGNPEGSYGTLVAGEPLFAGNTPWSWDASVSYQDVFLRRYVNAQLYTFSDKGGTLPWEYHSLQSVAAYEVTRSFGWEYKHDFTLGAGISRSVNAVPTTAGVPATTIADFQSQYVPLSDTRVGPSLQYHTYDTHFLRVIDFDTLALQEDYRLGHDVVLRVYPSFRGLGSTRDVLGLYGAVQYTWAVRDGLFRLAFQSTTEPEADKNWDVADAAIQPTAHLATPSIGNLGRIVLDGTLLYRWRNYLNQTEILGGADRLRGFPTNFFVGANVMSYNLEARSRPVEIFSMELAGVAFLDVGNAFTGWNNFIPYQAVGVGIRTLFPWLDRTVFQADIGFPIERPLDSTGAPIPPYSFIISFGQAFSTPTVAPAPVLPTGQGPDSP